MAPKDQKKPNILIIWGDDIGWLKNLPSASIRAT